MGLNSGEVVVGAVGDDLNVDYTAIGHTVGLASRMEQLAEPGKAYVTGMTALLVEGWFDLVDHGDFDVKGVPEAVPVFELAGTGSARTRVEVAGRVLLMDEEFKELLPVLFDFLGVPDSDRPAPANPDARHRQLVTAVRRMVQTGGHDGPALLLYEDLHWLDPGSELFLEHLIDALPASRTLVVVNFRPEFQADWMRKSYYHQLPL